MLAYLLLVVVFLTGALAAQQAGRLLEAVSATDAPTDAIINTLAALLPTLLTLAIPMSVLLAAIIGLSQLGGDSEIIAMQAAGLGAFSLARPVIIICGLITLLSVYLNLSVAPSAVRTLREIELRAAKYKLESPVEPHTFNTKIPEYVLYVREGNKEKGTWQNVFIFNKKPDGNMRLITAGEGRIDFAKELQGEKGSELFLRDAVMLSTGPAQTVAPQQRVEGGWTLDRAGQTRLTFPTNRQDILQKLQQRPFELDEMSLEELRKLAQGPPGPEQRTAAVLAQKKLALSFGPLVMGLLGVSLGARVRRGGRGAGLALGFLALIIYQLVALVGEQMARKGTLPAVAGVWLAPCLAVIFSVFWLTSRNLRFGLRGWWRRLWPWREASRGENARLLEESGAAVRSKGPRQPRYRASFPAYLDWTLARTLFSLFILTLSILTLLFLTFTLFELWRFVTPNQEGYWLMAKYLFFLLPLTLAQTLPGAGLIAVLATYALMSRRLEAVAWWASGLSAYRLMLPALLFAVLLGGSLWFMQEKIMPPSNLIQDELRAQIKGSPKIKTSERQWLAPADGATLYSFNYDVASGGLRDLSVFRFAAGGTHLNEVITAKSAQWQDKQNLQLADVETVKINEGRVKAEKQGQRTITLSEPAELFIPSSDKPSQMSAADLKLYSQAAGGRGEEMSVLRTALFSKYAAPFGAIALVLLGAPLALSFDRRKILNAMGAAVAASLLFWVLSNVFQQLGARGLIAPAVAGWTPTAIFSCLAAFLLSRART
jgi:LPS export ABC transporter permease LptG